MSKLVFVVDDETCIADTLAAILRNSGYETRAFYRADTAMAACEHASPDMLITDVMMPGINGVDLAIMIRNRFPECKILLFSGQASTVDLLRETRTQGYSFELLAKPVHPKELLAKLGDDDRPVRESAVAQSLQDDRAGGERSHSVN